MADIKQYSPRGDLIIGEDNSVHSLVGILKSLGSDAQPVGKVKNIDISKYAPMNGRIVDENGDIYNLVDLLTSISRGGGGGEGTSNYNKLTNIPKINGVELKGNVTAAELGIAGTDDIEDMSEQIEKKISAEIKGETLILS